MLLQLKYIKSFFEKYKKVTSINFGSHFNDYLSINQSNAFLTIIPFSLDSGILSNVKIIFV